MAGFYERSAILSRSKERFTDFNTLNTYLTSKGSTFGRSIPLYSIGSDGNDTNIIGHWGYDSNGLIVPMGVIRFDRITDGGHAVIASVTDGTTAVVKTDPVSTLPTSGQALAFDLSAGTNLYSGINFSISDTTLTLPDTTGLAAGDIIYAQGRSEFTWGSGSNFAPLKNGMCFKSGSNWNGLYVSGACISEIDRFRKRSLIAILPNTMDKVAVLPLSQTNDCHMVGWFKEYHQFVIGGYEKQASTNRTMINISGSKPVALATTWYEYLTTLLTLTYTGEQVGASGWHGFQANSDGTNYWNGTYHGSDKRDYTNNMRLMFSSSYPIVWKSLRY